MKTGERIEQLAKERGMSLRKLATLAGVSYNTVYSAVKRKSNRIDMNTLGRLASVLQVSVADLSGVDYEIHSDGSGVAVIDLDKIDKETAQRLDPGKEIKGKQIGFLLHNESDRKALDYLLQNNGTDPEWAERLLTAFYKLNFPMQQMLISNAEQMVQNMEYFSVLAEIKQNCQEE